MRVSIFILLFLFFHSFIGFSQDWIQLGLDIDGDQDGSGHSVSLSDDGTIVVFKKK